MSLLLPLNLVQFLQLDLRHLRLLPCALRLLHRLVRELNHYLLLPQDP